MSDLPLIASAFATGFVAPTTVAWYALTSQRRDSQRRSRDDLRSVLDDAAHALGESRRAIDAVAELWRNGAAPATAEVEAAYQRHRTAATAAQDANDRIAIRLGLKHNAATCFHASAAALDACAARLTPYLHDAVGPADRAGFDAARADFARALEAYYRAAREATSDDSRTAPRIVAIVALLIVVAGAVLIGAAIGQASADPERRGPACPMVPLTPSFFP